MKELFVFVSLLLLYNANYTTLNMPKIKNKKIFQFLFKTQKLVE